MLEIVSKAQCFNIPEAKDIQFMPPNLVLFQSPLLEAGRYCSVVVPEPLSLYLMLHLSVQRLHFLELFTTATGNS